MAGMDNSDETPDDFTDIEELALQCRFASCTHGREPGCAVRRALDEGTLARSRFDEYLDARDELYYQEERAGHKNVLREEKERLLKKAAPSRSQSHAKNRKHSGKKREEEW
ncbi:MAG: hypothetical protein LBR61_06465 [Synergistaceae bacterium]|jgi:ribosome biogenesis GTPase|nr:hypothetical protein [Synergistaceae bacterium]